MDKKPEQQPKSNEATGSKNSATVIDKAWFQMEAIRKRFYDQSVWIPLRASQNIETPELLHKPGSKDEFFGVGTLAVYQDRKKDGDSLEWMDIGLIDSQAPYVNHKGTYIASDVRIDSDNIPLGIYLVLSRPGNAVEHAEWHLHQDFIMAFNLKREGDSWVDIDEGYVEVARILRNKNNSPAVLEVKAEYLKEYLCARNMLLRLSLYRSRMLIAESPGELSSWEKTPPKVTDEKEYWECRVTAISENGMPYGSEAFVMHASRNDVDPEIDVPDYDSPTDAGTDIKTWVNKYEGEKLYRIHGELWRDEWVLPSSLSPRIKEDKVAATSHFIVDASGNTETQDTLIHGSRWLWFKPEIVEHILSIRGASLAWYTKDTGGLGCSPSSGVHFGINKLGLLNVFAVDIARLSAWEQKIWAGFNVGPDGKISEELLSSQMKAVPAPTQAPETGLDKAIQFTNKISEKVLGKKLFKHHAENDTLLKKTHRFRAVNQAGLLALAKDLCKLVVENIDTSAFKKHIIIEEDESIGSIKMLERLLAIQIGAEDAKKITAPLIGLNQMRQQDAHLQGQSTDYKDLLLLNEKNPFVEQAHQMLYQTVACIFMIGRILNELAENEKIKI